MLSSTVTPKRLNPEQVAVPTARGVPGLAGS